MKFCSLLTIYLVLCYSIGDCLPVNGTEVIAEVNCSTTQEVCLTPGCVHAASDLLNSIDQSVEPCDDFYKFACGGYINKTSIPEESNQMNLFVSLTDTVSAKLRLALEAPIAEDELHPLKMAKLFYKSCTNTEQIKKVGLKPLHAILKKLGGWPVISGDEWNNTMWDWESATYKGRQQGLLHVFFRFGIMTDLIDSTKRISGFDQPRFGTSRSYLLKGPDNVNVEAYYKLMVNVAVLLGAEEDVARQQLNESLHFEIALAKEATAPEARRNLRTMHNRVTVAELERQYPTVSWLQYINKHLAPYQELNETEEVLILDPKYIRGFTRIMQRTDRRVIANYFGWRVIFMLSEYMTEELRSLVLKYKTVVYGQKSFQPRWEECVEMLSHFLSIATGSLYVRHYFDENSKAAAESMVQDIKMEFNCILDQVTWMDAYTKNRAKKKLEAMTTHIAYPKELKDDDVISEFYEGLELSPDNYLKNVLDALLLTIAKAYGDLRKPVAQSDWLSKAKAHQVNAFYKAQENSIIFPAGILQGIFFDSERPRYMNYGAIGTVIGHEITHGFDDTGSQFDKDGNLVNWWEKETREHFRNRSKCIIDQYGEALVEEVGLRINGINTQGENIADNGGIKEAYRAYRNWANNHYEEQSLPGLPYSADQLFWLSAASIWCRVDTPESLIVSLLTGVHSPSRFRVNIAFANSPEFSRSWQCPMNSPMNPVKKCSVW